MEYTVCMLSKLESHTQSETQLISTARGVRTLRDFAITLGVSYGAIFQWESGETRPSVDRIMRWMNSPNPDVSKLGKSLFELRKREAAESERGRDENVHA